MVRRGSPVRVRHWALSFSRAFPSDPRHARESEVRNGYVRPPAGPSCNTAGAPAAQSPEAARRADPERSERVDGADGRRHDAKGMPCPRRVYRTVDEVDEEGAVSGPNLPIGVMTEHDSLLLTVAQAAELAGFSSRAIYRAIARGELRAVRVCSRLRVPRDWFDEWLERSVVQPEPALVIPRPRGSFKALLRDRDARSGS